VVFVDHVTGMVCLVSICYKENKSKISNINMDSLALWSLPNTRFIEDLRNETSVLMFYRMNKI